MTITHHIATWPEAFQEAYEERISIMDETGTENRFDVAKRAHADTWGRLQEWMETQEEAK